MKKSIAYAAMFATALSPIFSTPAFANHAVPNGDTLAEMASQCTAIGDDLGDAFTATLDPTSIVATQAGPPVDDGDPYNITNQVGVGNPALSDLLATGPGWHQNGGSQNVFTTGTATATWAVYTFDGEIATLTPFNFAFKCSVTETVVVPGQTENKGQCVSRIQTQGSTRNEAEEFCDDPANRQTLPPTTTQVPRAPVDGIPVPQDVEGSRLIVGGLSTDFPGLADDPYVVEDYAVANVLACISPDNNQTWVNKHGSELISPTFCTDAAAALGLTPISGKKGR